MKGYHILTPKIHIEPHIIEIPTVEADKSRSRLPHYGFSFIVYQESLSIYKLRFIYNYDGLPYIYFTLIPE